MTDFRETSTWERMTRGSMQRCDGRDCGHGLHPGAIMWITRRIAVNPTEGMRSHAIVLCEACRIRQIAQQWTAAAEVPDFVVRTGTSTNRGLAGGIPIDAAQYKRAAQQATRMLSEATAPAAPVMVPTEEEAVRREQKRAVKRSATT